MQGGSTVLLTASAFDSTAVAELLLAHGASVIAEDEVGSSHHITVSIYCNDQHPSFIRVSTVSHRSYTISVGRQYASIVDAHMHWYAILNGFHDVYDGMMSPQIPVLSDLV
jgi:hypothetical protein